VIECSETLDLAALQIKCGCPLLAEVLLAPARRIVDFHRLRLAWGASADKKLDGIGL
jgi:hypothetical protein